MTLKITKPKSSRTYSPKSYSGKAASLKVNLKIKTGSVRKGKLVVAKTAKTVGKPSLSKTVSIPRKGVSGSKSAALVKTSPMEKIMSDVFKPKGLLDVAKIFKKHRVARFNMRSAFKS